jgi:hypothetical protein
MINISDESVLLERGKTIGLLNPVCHIEHIFDDLEQEENAPTELNGRGDDEVDARGEPSKMVRRTTSGRSKSGSDGESSGSTTPLHSRRMVKPSNDEVYARGEPSEMVRRTTSGRSKSGSDGESSGSTTPLYSRRMVKPSDDEVDARREPSEMVRRTTSGRSKSGSDGESSGSTTPLRSRRMIKPSDDEVDKARSEKNTFLADGQTVSGDSKREPDASSASWTPGPVITSQERDTGVVNVLNCYLMEPSPNHCDDPEEDEVDEMTEQLPETLREMYIRGTTYLTGNQPRRLKELIENHIHLFSKSKLDIGTATGIKHDIRTGDAPPLSEPLRRLPIHRQEEADKQIREMLEADVIEESMSPWSCGWYWWRRKTRPSDSVWIFAA